MTPTDAHSESTGQPVQRPDTDDYDLLTFGEVSARLAEELAAEQNELSQMRRQRHPDARHIRLIEQRIALLSASEARYREQERTNGAYLRRFGTAPSPAAPTADTAQN